MILATTLFIVGAIDAMRTSGPRSDAPAGSRWKTFGWVLVACVSMGWVIGSVLFLGSVATWLLVPVVVAGGWWLLTRDIVGEMTSIGSGASTSTSLRSGVTVFLLLGVLGTITVLDGSFADRRSFPFQRGNPLVESLIGSLPVASIACLVGLLVFMTTTGNILVRLVVDLSTETLIGDRGGKSAPAADERSTSDRPPALGWMRRRRIGEDDSGTTGSSARQHPPVSSPRGGRIIGSVERLVLVGLLLAGLPEISVAVIAAKGIIRFPEISQSRDRAGSAEYFLVGNLTSWALAFGAAAIVRVLVMA